MAHLLERCSNVSGRNGEVGQHNTLAQIAPHCTTDLSDYKMFTVIRNTYQRIVSLYCMYYATGSGFSRVGLRFLNGSRRDYVTFPEFYHRLKEIYDEGGYHHYAADFFTFSKIDEVVPENLEIISFDNIDVEFKEMWCDKWGYEIPMEFPHINISEKAPTDGSLRNYLVRDPVFLKLMEEMYEEEIRQFGFKPY